MLSFVFRRFLDTRIFAPEPLTEAAQRRVREIGAEQIAQGKDLESLFRQAREEYDTWPRNHTPALNTWHDLEDRIFAEVFRDCPRPDNIYLVWIDDAPDPSDLRGPEPLRRVRQSGA